MPIYEYECTVCGHRFEMLQKVTDRPLKKCEKCKGKAERLISSPAIQFKGSGWYITDYARKGSASDSDSAKSEAPEKKKKKKKKKTSKKSDSKASSS